MFLSADINAVVEKDVAKSNSSTFPFKFLSVNKAFDIHYQVG